MKKYGIDISAHNGNIDFNKLKEQVDFIILRATWGTNTDSRFEEYYRECKAHGIPVGAYCYSYSLEAQTGIEEANYILNLIRGKQFEYPIYIDMEDADNYKRNHGMPSNTTLTAICNNFCDVIEKNGYYAGVYASQSWFNNQIKGITKYDKWIANWGTNDGTEQKDLSKLCELYQYTSEKYIIGKRFDGNVAYVDYPSIIKSKGLNGYGNQPQPVPILTPIKTLKVGDKVRICTASNYNYYVADDVQKIYGIVQVREDLNAGGASRFSWKDNGIPEKFVDIVNSNGKKTWNSDLIHMKKGYKFVFNRAFRISKTATDGGIKYYQLDAGIGDKYKFWVVGTYLYKV